MRTIDHLPDETLLEIFYFVTASTSTDNFPRAVSLTHVSRRWRKILLNCGGIWSNIHICHQDFNQVDTQIKRCQRAQLMVSIESPLELSFYSQFLQNVHGAAVLIRERRDQVTLLQAYMDCGLFYRLFGYEWPNLKEFTLTDSCSSGSSFHEGRYVYPLHSGPPKLKVLLVEGSPNWPMNVVTSLTIFRLKGTKTLKLETLAKFFRRNTSLETLELINLDVWKPSNWHRIEPIVLPHLVKLSVRDATCGCALALLRLPSLEQLRISSIRGQDPWTYSPWSEFCSRLHTVSLEAHHRSSSRNGITVTGWSKGMDTRSFLRFTEFNSLDHLGTALFGSLSRASLSSVTSVSFIKHMPDGCRSPSLIAAICNLLEHLPQVERMHLRPSRLVIGVVRRLSGDQKLCPGLRELGIKATESACKTVLSLVAGMKLRADDDRRRMITVKYSQDE